MAAQLASVRQVSMEASFALEGLATDKSRWEAEVATLRADLQTMESEKGEPRMGGLASRAVLGHPQHRANTFV